MLRYKGGESSGYFGLGFDFNVLRKERHFACLTRSRNYMTRVKTMEKKWTMLCRGCSTLDRTVLTSGGWAWGHFFYARFVDRKV